MMTLKKNFTIWSIDFNDEYGDFKRSLEEELHDEYCPESDVLLPTAYLAKKFVK